MGRWFGLDSKFYKWGTLLGDLIIITALWLICSIPIVTMGAATTALYYVTTRQLSNREGYVSRDFFKSFKSNFFQATLITIMILLIGGILLININHFNAETSLDTVIYLIQYVLLYELVIFTVYVFPILSRFKLRTFELIKTAFFMANRHLLTTFTCILLLIAICAVVMRWGILIVLCAGVYGILTSLMFMNLFRRYVPEMDRDKPEDKI